MATGTLPEAGQILNSLITSILLLDNDLSVHYANPAAQQLLAQSSRKLFSTPLPELLGLCLPQCRADARKPGRRPGFYR